MDKPYISFGDNDISMFAYCLGSATNSTDRDPIIINALNYSANRKYSNKMPYLITGRQDIPLNICKKEYFPKDMMSRYSFKDFENCMCVKTSDLVQNISYFFTDSYYSYYDFEVKFNDNIKSNRSLYNYYVDY